MHAGVCVHTHYMQTGVRVCAQTQCFFTANVSAGFAPPKHIYTFLKSPPLLIAE